MRLQSVEVSGWMPFAGRFTLLMPGGPIAVVGTHSGDPRRSNRAGKTALLEAITWCLYGVHRKRLDDSIINRTCKECEVVVVIGKSVTVRRSRVRGHSTKLVVSEYDVLAGETTDHVGEAAQVALDRAIGLGLEDYLATSCFRQGDVESIITRTAGERLALVSEWLQQSRWLQAKKIQAARTSAVDQDLAVKRGAEQVMKPYLLTAEAAEALANELEELRQSIGEVEQQVAHVHVRMQAALDAQTALAKYAELEVLRAKTIELRTQLGGRAGAEQKRAEALAVEVELAAIATAAHASVIELQHVRASGFDGVCPVTCEQCPAQQEVTEFVRSAASLLAERTEADLTAKVVWDRARAVSLEARQSVGLYERMTAEYQQVVVRGKVIQAALAGGLSQAALAKVPSAQADQVILNELRAKAAEASNRAGQVEAILEHAVESEAKHAGLVAQIKSAEQASRASHLALRAISSVPARIAAEQLGELEQEANQLLSGSGVTLRFSWARELADKAAVCDECGFVYLSKRGDACPTCRAVRGKKLAQELELLCDDGSGVEEDARYNSGGTRAVVGSAIRLAASAMLRRLRSSQAAWAVVDEPFGSLDAENREQLARTFAGMLGSVGLEQALVVSHDPVLLAALPNRIVIDRDGANSTVRLE